MKSSWIKPFYEELSITKAPVAYREFPGVPVRGEERSESAPRFYLRALESFHLLESVGLPTSNALAESSKNVAFIKNLSLHPPGRYRTVPSELVLRSFRSAVEFALEYAEELLDAYVFCAKTAQATGVSIPQFLEKESISQFLGPKLTTIGVNTWSIGRTARQGLNTRELGVNRDEFDTQYFSNLREHRGLWDLLMVLGGCYLVILGTLMARRQGELIDLKVGSMLNSSGSHLRFKARKSGTGDMRQTLERPIPAFASELLRLLENFQERLVAGGVLSETSNALMFPKEVNSGLLKAGQSSFNFMLDRFCDFFQTEIDKNGRRFYLRQHQLRRFFAMLFFWGNSFSGLDVLRWFMGHSDAEHLYHYISESTPGHVLRGVKADFVVEHAKAHDPQTLPLLDFIENHFGTREVLLLDSDELGEFIEELLANGSVTVEPHFMRGTGGTTYEVLICVSDNAQ
ncbi:hypothetical protein N0K08_11915 [Acidovorax sp. Be4]|uniref:Integrase n=1 Tax=Acidovorax bellezanensis TaxID=2976702 RepID=A0ABT2PLI8_9BURK|nr:hypothetical protein [Acidovorax sp. Be4]MCT9811345.1 hypothetical protein [Acidovorax sp. Be4]